MTEVEQLRKDVDALKQELLDLKMLLLTADQYIRYERIPQFVGDIQHEAGSEEITIPSP